MNRVAPVVVIVGPTASGKTALGIELARQFNGEIICADSRTVYKYMDIGTAKPTPAEQRVVAHHLLDVVEPDQAFTVVDFKRLAEQAITEIWARGHVPIMVGGSGLYVDAVLFDYSFSPEGAERDPINPRHAHQNNPHTKHLLRKNTIVLGLNVPREVLVQRIEGRTEKMVEDGFVDEVRWLSGQYPDARALLAPGYKAMMAYIQGQVSLEEATHQFVRNDRQLARRQLAWFRRNKSIQWLDDPSNAVEFVTTFLNKKQ